MKLLGPDEIHEAAYIEACERDSPNSIGFDALCESIAERMSMQQEERLRCTPSLTMHEVGDALWHAGKHDAYYAHRYYTEERDKFISAAYQLDQLHGSLTRALNECIGMLSVGLSALNKTEGDAIRVQVMRERAEVCIDILRKQIEALKD